MKAKDIAEDLTSRKFKDSIKMISLLDLYVAKL